MHRGRHAAAGCHVASVTRVEGEQRAASAASSRTASTSTASSRTRRIRMVAEASPTSNWDTIQDVFYRKEELYQMAWSVQDLSDYVAAVAQMGGPVALLRDERKMVELGRHTAGKPKINVYSSAGQQMASLTWELPTPVFMAWTALEELLVLAEDGTYRLYTLAGEYRQCTLGAEVNELGVVGAEVYDGGLVVLHGGLGFVHVKGWAGGRAVQLSTQALPEVPHCWTLTPPDRSMSGHVEILAAVGSTVLTIDELETVDQHLSRGPFTPITPSPNGKFLALLTAASTLWVVSSDFSRNLSEVDVSGLGLIGGTPDGPPVKMEWCGDHAVAMLWKSGSVAIIGPGGDCLSYMYHPAALIVGEIDGLRIISSETCEFVQKVPESALAVFQPGSTRPAATLYEALQQFDRKSPKADEHIRSIRPDLPEAVDTCIEAAGTCWDAYWQRRLLKAALFGRAFLDLYNPIDLVNMAQSLKVLNAVRFHEVGIPLSYEQYVATSPESLVLRLLVRNQHLLALRICRHLQLRVDPVLRHWACAKIAADAEDPNAGSDDALRRAIVTKFEKEGGKGASYAEIARKAWQSGRTSLATMLLDHEPQAANQVPLLLAMKADRPALVKALDSGDTDLVFNVLLHLKSKLAPGDFFSLVDDGSPQLAPAVKLLQVYGKDADRAMLRDFYYQDDRRAESACLEIEEAGQTSNSDDRLAGYAKAVRFFSEDKERVFETKMMEGAQRLLKVQQTMEAETEHKYTFVGLSVNDTISHLLLNRLSKRADKIRADFKVPDKRFWWLKLKALAELKDWDGLEAFAKSKKSPIGYEPFVSHLLAVGQPSKAVVYVPRCDAKQRVDLYVKCGDWARAAQECKDRGDKARIQELRNMAPTTIAQREVDDVIRRWGQK